MIELIGNKLAQEGQVIFEMNYNRPILSTGYGHAIIKVDRGFFKIKDKPNLHFFYYYSHENYGDKVIINLAAKKDEKIKLVLTEKDGMIHTSLEDVNIEYNRCRIYFKCDRINGVYGFGETFAKFNLLGHRVKVWVQEHVPFRHIIKKVIFTYLFMKTPLCKFEKYSSYMAQPTFITSNKAFVHVNTDTYCVFDFRNKNRWCIEVWGTDFDIIIAGAANYEHLMNKMTSILGRMPKVPKWIYNGVILGIQDGCKRCDEKLDVMLENDVKVSGIWAQDWEGQRITGFGKQLMWDWSVDEKLYGELKEYILKWNNEGVQFLGYINPFLATEGKLYKHAYDNGYLVLDEAGEPYLVKITTFKAAMIDLTNPETCTWIKEVIKRNMIGVGLRGWMADFGEYLPTDAVLKNGDPMNMHNQWPVLWAKVNREAVIESGMEDDIFFFTRAGSTGTGRYTSMMWNGDQHVDWSRDYGIASIVNSQLSLSASGIGASHSDIGGYTTFGKVRRSKELILRWLEMSAFSPAMRTHEGNRPDDNVHFHSDDETIKAFARFTNIFVQISPYIKECVDHATKTGMPAIRPVFFHFENDERLFKIDDTYLLGRDILVSPIVKRNQNSKRVIIPNDIWVHMFTGEKYCKGEYTIDAPLGTPPVFYRQSSEYRELFESVKDIKKA